MQRIVSTLAAIATLAVLSLGAAGGALGADQAGDAQRWDDLKAIVFKDRPVRDGRGMISLEAPVRAVDPASTPVSVSVLTASAPSHTDIRALYLFIDENPVPLAAHVVFGPAADPGVLSLRVRVDQYSLVHAVAETTTGDLYAVSTFVKATGGCSAPPGVSEDDALKGVGEMTLRRLSPLSDSRGVKVMLSIRHPNFNGMQMDQITRLYSLARYINSIDISYGAEKALHVDSDISLSSDPVIVFGLADQGGKALTVTAHDTKGAVFTHSFTVPAQAG